MPLHIWLPEAHVEAPTVGSVILAAILLKFGYYGISKTIISICSSDILHVLFTFFLSCCCISLLLSACVALRQLDLKKIVAYSSIVHMNLAMLGLFVFSYSGFCGSLFLMFSHGIISGAMFFCIGFLYERFHVRNIMYFGGLSQVMPVFASLFFFVMFNNMSLPGTPNFTGEFLVFVSLFEESLLLVLFGLTSVLFVSLFCLLVLSRSIFYQISGFLTKNLVDLNLFEFTILFFLCSYMLFTGIFPECIFQFF